MILQIFYIESNTHVFGYEKITTDDFPRNKEDSSIEIELHFLAHGFNDLKYDGKLMLKQIYNLGKTIKLPMID